MNSQLRKIVVGTSLDAGSDPVVKAALLLRQKTGAEVHLVHAFSLPMSFAGGVYALHTPIEVDVPATHDSARVAAQLARVGASETDFANIVVLTGSSDQLLVRVAEEIKADLVVVGGSETTPGLQPFLGSTADRLLRRTLCPVLVVRGDFALPRRVLAPTDLSPLSEAAIGRGLAVIDQLGAPDVEALFVVSPLDREGSVHFSPDQIDRFALEQLEAFLGRLPARSGTTHSVLRSGHARSQVTEYLATHPEIDLVILGTHGRSGFERFLLGSVAAELLRRLHVTALVVPPEVKESTLGF